MSNQNRRTIEYYNLSDLQLDKLNPRLPKSKQNKSEEEIIDFLLLEAATLELMESIGENDFFDGEMLLVIPDGHGKFIVVEGNRRLTAVMLLNNPALARVKKAATKEISDAAKYRPTKLPCLVFDNREDIQKYIGFVHITGKKTWRLLEKARYLYEFSHTEGFSSLSFSDTCKEIARIIGSRSPYVGKMLVSYDLYRIIEDEGFYNVRGLTDSSFYLNYFSDGLLKENIKKYLNVDLESETPIANLNREHLKELTIWWFQKNEGGVSRVIGDSEGMKKLNAVLGNEDALVAFKRGESIDVAYEMTNDIDQQFENKVKESLKAIEQADRLSNKVKVFYYDLRDDINSVRKIARKIMMFSAQNEKDEDEL